VPVGGGRGGGGDAGDPAGPEAEALMGGTAGGLAGTAGPAGAFLEPQCNTASPGFASDQSRNYRNSETL
jgi:hypothetical protein